MSVGHTFLEVAEATTAAAALDTVAECWDKPSALDRMTVGTLVAHSAGAIINVETALDSTSNTTESANSVTWADDAADYYIRAIKLLNYDEGADGSGQSQIRDWSSEFASLGAETVVSTANESLERLRPRLNLLTNQPVHVYGGIHMDVEPYLETRIAELTVHLDDLACSPALVGASIKPAPADAWSITAAVFTTLAVRRHGPRAVVNRLVRAERATIDITAL